MKYRMLALLIAVAVAIGLIATAQTVRPYSRTIVDLSWPNCTAPPDHNFYSGIIGVNGGLDFHYNPCLTQQAALFGQYTLYMNTGYPGVSYAKKFGNTPIPCIGNDNQCLAYDYGFQAAQRTIQYADLHNAHTNTWWLDVETDNSWSDSTTINRIALEGMLAAIHQDAPLTSIGFYAYPGQWNLITGNWDNGAAAWVATGTLSKAAAVAACHLPSFTGGPVLLTQYTAGLDHNISCT
jgi:hypothetical protein